MATFLLVHGAWHGAWCWAKVVPLLEARGHKAIAIDLPGHGEDRRPLGEMTLDAYGRKVVEAAETLSERPYVVGHSMGGGVISAAAEMNPDVIERLVYLTAFLPTDGKSMIDTSQDPTNELMPRVTQFAEDGQSVSIAPELLREAFYADCSDDDVAFARERLCLQSVAPLAAPIAASPDRYHRVPRDYIACTEDRAINYTLQQQMLADVPCERVATLDTSHSPFFSAPEALADVLAGFAG